MKKNVLLLSTVGVAVIVAGLYAAKNLNQQAPVEPGTIEHPAADVSTITSTEDKVVATYNNGTPIYKSEIDNKLKSMFGSKLPKGQADFDQFPKEVRENFIKNIITVKLITEEATKANVTESDEYKELLAEAKEELQQKVFVLGKLKDLATDEAVQQRYEQFVKEQSEKEEVKARHILVATEDEAKAIAEEIKKGGNFEEIAKEKSSDSSKDKGGDLGYFSKGQMVKQFEDAAFALKVGEVSAPIKTDFGWHIIKVDDKRKIAVPTFEEMKQKFKDEIGQKALQDYIEKLQNDAAIEIKPMDTAPEAASDTTK